ncbi:hypothetical protein ZIOFF_051822 [Zingiber officinale]|uniref:Uncharacterized protein n=1 Tax=Zingiber officinale TaxID=94328 RepID=A0A8J5G2Y8_ZINOF|nr:hypothetical protein ZIOFF_051822 [Zingiber officinale]
MNKFVENEIPREITNDIKGVIKGVWPTWKKVPSDIKDLLWENFKLRYNWDNFTDREMKKVWNENSSERYRASIHLAKKAALSSAQEDLGRKPDILDMIGRGPDWMEANIWNDLVKIHWNKPDHKIKCEIARKNKMTAKDGSTIKHIESSISFVAHRERMTDVPVGNLKANQTQSTEGPIGIREKKRGILVKSLFRALREERRHCSRGACFRIFLPPPSSHVLGLPCRLRHQPLAQAYPPHTGKPLRPHSFHRHALTLALTPLLPLHADAADSSSPFLLSTPPESPFPSRTPLLPSGRTTGCRTPPASQPPHRLHRRSPPFSHASSTPSPSP